MSDLKPIAYSVPHTAVRVGISRSGLWALIRAGKGPRVTTIGRRSVILVSDCDAWLTASQSAVA
jgi:predicted DNA-binding transcriptional regulator AlpA